MRVEEIQTVYDMYSYIGQGKSYKKAWRSSLRKWKLVSDRNLSYPEDKECGFCKVQRNVNTFSSQCVECPVLDICRLNDSGDKFASIDPQYAIQYLADNKERIFNL